MDLDLFGIERFAIVSSSRVNSDEGEHEPSVKVPLEVEDWASLADRWAVDCATKLNRPFSHPR